MPEHLTRRDLKTPDHFTTTVGGAVDYFGLHRTQAIRIAGAVVLAILLGAGVYLWMDHNRSVREEKLAEAMQVSGAPVGTPTPGVAISFATQDQKDAAEIKAYSGIAGLYSGSREGAIAEYTLAGIAAKAGKNDEARRRYQAAADSGDKEYASLGKLALAQFDFAENRAADGEKILRDLMDHPTALVSKDQATFTLARELGKTKPAQARQLLTGLVTKSGAVGQAANQALGELPPK